MERILRPVWSMALFTGFFHRLVNICETKIFFSIFVATETEVYTIHGQKELTLRGMRIMAHNTITPRHRTMNIVLCGHVVFVAGKTNICQFFLREQKFSLGLVGIMTDDTLFFYRRVNIFAL
jgi:hypothetical protein